MRSTILLLAARAPTASMNSLLNQSLTLRQLPVFLTQSLPKHGQRKDSDDDEGKQSRQIAIPAFTQPDSTRVHKPKIEAQRGEEERNGNGQELEGCLQHCVGRQGAAPDLFGAVAWVVPNATVPEPDAEGLGVHGEELPLLKECEVDA